MHHMGLVIEQIMHEDARVTEARRLQRQRHASPFLRRALTSLREALRSDSGLGVTDTDPRPVAADRPRTAVVGLGRVASAG